VWQLSDDRNGPEGDELRWWRNTLSAVGLRQEEPNA
jgi:hypothetical protein